MIREYAPIPLIPAAWAMTFATTTYPLISTYWIEHMHYFMLLFLTGFTLLSWKEMGEDQVLDIWRKVIAAGILFTAIGALSFAFTEHQFILGLISISYWFLAPGIALYKSATHMNRYSDLYTKLFYISTIAYAIFLASLIIDLEITSYNELGIISYILIAAAQTLSIIAASKMDN